MNEYRFEEVKYANITHNYSHYTSGKLNANIMHFGYQRQTIHHTTSYKKKYVQFNFS